MHRQENENGAPLKTFLSSELNLQETFPSYRTCFKCVSVFPPSLPSSRFSPRSKPQCWARKVRLHSTRYVREWWEEFLELHVAGTEEDQEATEMLVGNAQNLMQSVKLTVTAAEAASIICSW